jgi:hypothetical protein
MIKIIIILFLLFLTSCQSLTQEECEKHWMILWNNKCIFENPEDECKVSWKVLWYVYEWYDPSQSQVICKSPWEICRKQCRTLFDDINDTWWSDLHSYTISWDINECVSECKKEFTTLQ